MLSVFISTGKRSMKKTAVVTGVSSGIGFATAKHLLEKGYRVFGSVRKQTDAQVAQEKLGENFSPLLFDVTDQQAIEKAAAQVGAELGGENLTALVNNAGVCPMSPMLHSPLDEVRHAIEVNAIGLLAVTQGFARLLGARKDAPANPGTLVNITSVNAAIAIPLFGGYNASKFAAHGISETLRRELSIYGINVASIQPAEVKTDIQGKINDDQLKEQYGNTDYWPAIAMQLETRKTGKNNNIIPVEKVTGKVVEAIESPRPKADYPLHILWRLNQLLPSKIMDKLLNKFGGINRC